MRRIFAKNLRRDIFVYRLAKKCGCATLTSSSASALKKIPAPVPFANCAAPTIRTPKSGSSQSNRKVKATIHWVSAAHALQAEVRLYDHLFNKEDPDDIPEGMDWLANINPKSLDRLTACRVEPELATAVIGERYQFERTRLFLCRQRFQGRRIGV
jgi:glutamyl/glutaminyl-tRNA synthetase